MLHLGFSQGEGERKKGEEERKRKQLIRTFLLHSSITGKPLSSSSPDTEVPNKGGKHHMLTNSLFSSNTIY